MQDVLIYIFAPLMIAITAWTVGNVLTDEGMILNGLYNYLGKHLPLWIWKPLIGCSYCMGGQWALWAYLFLFEYNFFLHVYFICATIFLIELLTKIMTDYEKA